MSRIPLTTAQSAVLDKLGLKSSGLLITKDGTPELSDLRNNTLLRLSERQKAALQSSSRQDVEGLQIDPLTKTVRTLTAAEAAKITAMWGEGGE